MTPEAVLGVLALILGPTGGVYIGIRAGLNGTREAVRRIEVKVDHLADALPAVKERVSVLETRMGAEERRL